MLRNYFVINIFLVIVSAYLGSALYDVVKRPLVIPDETAVESQKKEAAVAKKPARSKKTGSFNVISEKDLFRPDRIAPTVKKEEKADVPPPKDQPKLFGTIILDDKKTAILQDPESKKSKIYSENETVGSYTVSEIHENKVVLSYKGETVEVRLRDEKGVKPVKRPQVKRPTQVRKPPQRQPRQPRRPRRRPVRRSQGGPVPPPQGGSTE